MTQTNRSRGPIQAALSFDRDTDVSGNADGSLILAGCGLRDAEGREIDGADVRVPERLGRDATLHMALTTDPILCGIAPGDDGWLVVSIERHAAVAAFRELPLAA